MVTKLRLLFAAVVLRRKMSILHNNVVIGKFFFSFILIKK
jgi:hypothetical protein